MANRSQISLKLFQKKFFEPNMIMHIWILKIAGQGLEFQFWPLLHSKSISKCSKRNATTLLSVAPPRSRAGKSFPRQCGNALKKPSSNDLRPAPSVSTRVPSISKRSSLSAWLTGIQEFRTSPGRNRAILGSGIFLLLLNFGCSIAHLIVSVLIVSIILFVSCVCGFHLLEIDVFIVGTEFTHLFLFGKGR